MIRTPETLAFGVRDRRGSRTGEIELLSSGPAPAIFPSGGRVGLLDRIEARTVLGGVAPGVQRVADEGAVTGAVIGLQFGQRDDLIDDARAVPGRSWEPSICRENTRRLKSSSRSSRMPRRTRRSCRRVCCRWVSQPIISWPIIRMHPGTSGLLVSQSRPGLAFAPLQAQASGHGDGVDKDTVSYLSSTAGSPKRARTRIEVGLAERLVVAQRRVRPADVHRAKSRHSCQVRGRIVSAGPASTAGSPASRSKNSSVAVGFQRPELRGLADAALPTSTPRHGARPDADLQ